MDRTKNNNNYLNRRNYAILQFVASSSTVRATEFRQLPILLSIRKKICSLSFIVIMTDIQNFYDRNSVTPRPAR
jgi:hypothetical protein